MSAKGKKTAEYEAVHDNLHPLATKLQHNLHDLALKFFQEKLISKNELDACNECKPKLPRTIAVLSSILDAIEGNKGVYGVFLAILDEQADLDDMVKSIKTSYKSKSSESEKDSAFFDDVDHHHHPTYTATTHVNYGSELVVSGNAATSLTVPHSQGEGSASVITGLEGSFSEHSPIQTSDQFSHESMEHVTSHQCGGQPMAEYVSLRQQYQQQKCELDDTIKGLNTRQMEQDRLIEKLKSDKAEYEKEICKYEKEIYQLKSTCTKLIEEKNLAEQRANDIEQEYQKKVDELQKQLQKMEEKEDEAKITLAEIKANLAKVELAKEKNTKTLTKRIHQLEMSMKQLENDKTIITLTKDNEIATSKQKVAELLAQNAQLEAQHCKEELESLRKILKNSSL